MLNILSHTGTSTVLGFDHLVEWFTELRKILTYVCQFIKKDTDEQLDDEAHGARSRGVPNTITFVLMEYATFPVHGCIRQPRNSSNFIQEFL